MEKIDLTPRDRQVLWGILGAMDGRRPQTPAAEGAAAGALGELREALRGLQAIADRLEGALRERRP